MTLPPLVIDVGDSTAYLGPLSLDIRPPLTTEARAFLHGFLDNLDAGEASTFTTTDSEVDEDETGCPEEFSSRPLSFGTHPLLAHYRAGWQAAATYWTDMQVRSEGGAR